MGPPALRPNEGARRSLRSQAPRVRPRARGAGGLRSPRLDRKSESPGQARAAPARARDRPRGAEAGDAPPAGPERPPCARAPRRSRRARRGPRWPSGDAPRATARASDATRPRSRAGTFSAFRESRRGAGARAVVERRRLARQQLEEQHAERVEVVRGQRRLARALLRAHAGPRAAAADDDPVLVRVRHRGDAEVREVRAARVVEQHVRGLDVAVHHAEVVEIGERVGHVTAQARRSRPDPRPRRAPASPPGMWRRVTAQKRSPEWKAYTGTMRG